MGKKLGRERMMLDLTPHRGSVILTSPERLSPALMRKLGKQLAARHDRMVMELLTFPFGAVSPPIARPEPMGRSFWPLSMTVTS